MSLFITSVDPNGYERHFHCNCFSLEFALEVLTAISLLGGLFLRIDLVEDNQRVQLPVEVFDGRSFALPLQQLEREWQQLISKPRPIEAVKSMDTDL